MFVNLQRLSLSTPKLRLLGRVVWGLVLLGWLLIAVAWATFHWLIVPRIEQIRPWLETRTTQALGIPVHIGAIRVVPTEQTQLLPSFELVDVSLHDPKGHGGIDLARVQVDLSLQSMWKLGFERIAIDAPDLEVRRSKEGRLWVAGIELPTQASSDSDASDWVFSQSQWTVSQGRLRWVDETQQTPPLELDQVVLRLHNTHLTHELRLDATPPQNMGQRVSIRARMRQPLFFASAGQWQRWQGEVYAESPAFKWDAWRQFLPKTIETSGGEGSARMWLAVDQAAVQSVTADLAMDRLHVRLQSDLPALDVRHLQGRMQWRWSQDGWGVDLQGLDFESQDGWRWRSGNLHWAGSTQGDAKLGRAEVQVHDVDFAALQQLAQYLPLKQGIRQALTSYAPSGQLEHLLAHWQMAQGSVESFDAQGRVSQLAVAARPGLNPLAGKGQEGELGSPGFAGVSADFNLNQAGGTASVRVDQGHLEIPGLWAEPRMDLDRFAGLVRWHQDAGRTDVQIQNARFANADAQGEFQLKWNTGANEAKRFPGELDLQGSFVRAKAAAVYRYLPLAIPASVRDYLQHALLQGEARNANFRVKGPLEKFPFASGKEGEFRINAKAVDVRYAYVPAHLQPGVNKSWPALTQVTGDFAMDGLGLSLRNLSTRVDGLPSLRVSNAQVHIPDLSHDAKVSARLQVQGALDELVHGYVAGSPLDGLLDGVMGSVRGTGNADAQVSFELPVLRPEATSVTGQVKLTGNDVSWSAELPKITRARGTVLFSDKGFALAGVQARVLGGDVRADGGTLPGTKSPGTAPPKLRIQGVLTAQGLRQESQLGPLASLGQHISGATNYAVEMTVNRGGPEIQLTTNLMGLGLNLPAPLDKLPEQSWPTRLQILPAMSEVAPSAARPAATRFDTLRLDLGSSLNARFLREHAQGQTTVRKGMIVVGQWSAQGVNLPESGVSTSVQLDKLDLDAWRGLQQSVAVAANRPETSALVMSTLQDYLPTRWMLKLGSVHSHGQTFTQVAGGGSREGQTWRVNLDAKELSGYIEYRASPQDRSDKIYARMNRVVLARDNAQGADSLLDESMESIPDLDVVINQFELKGRNLGRVEIDATNSGRARRDAGTREWRLNKLRLSLPEAELSGTGRWAIVQEPGQLNDAVVPALAIGQIGAARKSERRQTELDFQLDVHDAGALLTRFNMPGVLRAGKGRMEGKTLWVGSPFDVDYASLSGTLNLDIESGQFLKADPGLAKLLGVLSLQSLPRRLTLDFRDVFSQGFAFDRIRGDAQIQAGVASTQNLQMKGVSAAVMMSGNADLTRETADLHVVVVPEINAGTASLIAAWINPAVGLSSFLAQLLLRGPAIAAATQEFQIKGPWADPQIIQIEASSKTAHPTSSANP